MSQKLLINTIIGTIILLAVAGGVGYYLWMQTNILSPSASESAPVLHTSQQTSPNPTPTSILSQNQTAGWKTYRNEKYGFEFEMPAGYVPLKEIEGWLVFSSSDGEFQLKPSRGIGDFILLVGDGISYKYNFQQDAFELAESRPGLYPSSYYGLKPLKRNARGSSFYNSNVGGGIVISNVYTFVSEEADVVIRLRVISGEGHSESGVDYRANMAARDIEKVINSFTFVGQR